MRTTPVLKGAPGSHGLARSDAVYPLIGGMAINGGVGVDLLYFPDRSPENAHFLPVAWDRGRAACFGPLGSALPKFLDVFVFILLTGAVVPGLARAAWRCLEVTDPHCPYPRVLSEGSSTVARNLTTMSECTLTEQ